MTFIYLHSINECRHCRRAAGAHHGPHFTASRGPFLPSGDSQSVLFCGSSTAIGFGSLAFASIDALASLGKVAVVGILISMLVSVVIVPGVRGRSI